MKKFVLACLIGFSCLMMSCSSTSVVVCTATVLGMDVDWDQRNYVPHVKAGYVRGAIASVPTDRANEKASEKLASKGQNANAGAGNATPIAVELSLENPFSFLSFIGFGTPMRLNDRILIGNDAVKYQQMLMLKDASGKIDPSVVAAVKAVNSLPDAVVPTASTKVDSGVKIPEAKIPASTGVDSGKK